MKTTNLLGFTVAACLSVTVAQADAGSLAAKASYASELSPVLAVSPKAASARTLASRGTVNSGATMYGGFELAQSTVVYVLVRGNSMATLGVTNNYLDRPRFRLYNANGQDLVFDNANRPGFNFCSSSIPDDAAVINFYQARGAPVSANDACLGATFQPGVYTFTVTPATSANAGITSSPSSGEILFEVTLGP